MEQTRTSCGDDAGSDTVIDRRAYPEAALHVRALSDAPPGSSSHEITAETPLDIDPTPPPTEPASNPEPTVATKLDPGITHLVPGTLVGEFVIDRLLGAGAMGQVYGGHHEHLGKRVALKVIAPSLSRDRGALERFAQESAALARLSHPNIVGVIGLGTLPGDGRAYYVMEWIDGESLQARIDRDPLPRDLALDVLDQIARGLAAAHAAGIVHRDLKPDNVFLQRVGHEPVPVVRIVDLGLAKLSAHRRTEETAVNVLFGTPAYLSPEQSRSARDVGSATDVYALGVVAYELVCGRLPFVYDNGAELIAAHQTELPPRPRDLAPDLDPRLDALLYAMLAKDPAYRPTLAVVRSALAAARTAPLAGRVARTSAAVTPPRAAVRTAQVRRGLLGTFAGFMLLSFVAAGAVLRHRTHPRAAAAAPTAAAAHASPADAVVSTIEQRPTHTAPMPTTAALALTPSPVQSVEPVGRPVHVASPQRPKISPDVGAAAPPAPVMSPVVVLPVDAGPSPDASKPQTPTAVEPSVTPNTPVDHAPPRPADHGSLRLPRDPKDRTFDPFHRASP